MGDPHAAVRLIARSQLVLFAVFTIAVIAMRGHIPAPWSLTSFAMTILGLGVVAVLSRRARRRPAPELGVQDTIEPRDNRQ